MIYAQSIYCGDDTTGIELKTEVMSKLRSDEVYLVATPGLILEAGKRYGRAAFAQNNVTRKLKQLGIGMCVIDATSNEMRDLVDAEETSTEKEAKSNALRELKIR